MNSKSKYAFSPKNFDFSESELLDKQVLYTWRNIVMDAEKRDLENNVPLCKMEETHSSAPVCSNYVIEQCFKELHDNLNSCLQKIINHVK